MVPEGKDAGSLAVPDDADLDLLETRTPTQDVEAGTGHDDRVTARRPPAR